MSFRRRNVGLGSPPLRAGGLSDRAGAAASRRENQASLPPPGIRPSPVDGRPTTSTGTATLDELLAGHAGLALGTSLLVEEQGTTEYAGALLRFYAAEGLVQGHHVHVVGLPEQWGRNLPGLVTSNGNGEEKKGSSEKMRIAWRYENPGRYGGETGSTRGGQSSLPSHALV